MNEFENQLEWNSSSWSIENGDNSIDIDINLKNTESKVLIVTLNGAKKQEDYFKNGPFFLGKGVAKDIKANFLFISDPTFTKDLNIHLGWYLGTKNNPTQDKIADLINIITNKLKFEKVIFFSGSGGGFASLILSKKIKTPNLSIIWNPQTNILNYNKDIVETLAKRAFDSEIEELPKFIETNLNNLFQNNNNKIFYLQNLKDHHVRKHLNPFLSVHGLKNYNKIFHG